MDATDRISTNEAKREEAEEVKQSVKQEEEEEEEVIDLSEEEEPKTALESTATPAFLAAALARAEETESAARTAVCAAQMDLKNGVKEMSEMRQWGEREEAKAESNAAKMRVKLAVRRANGRVVERMRAIEARMASMFQWHDAAAAELQALKGLVDVVGGGVGEPASKKAKKQ